MQIILKDTVFSFYVQYTKSKKFRLEVTPEGHITVKAPAKATEEQILEFMRLNTKPLLAFQERLEKREYVSSKKTYTETETFLYMGKPCKLDELLDTIPQSPEEAQLLLKKIYTKKTKQLVKKRVAYFEKIIGVKAKGLTVVDSPLSWGTCNSHGELTFNYRLSMAPAQVIDYVVIHELCHLLHLNHDRSFWRKVGAYDPHFKEHEAYLAKFGIVMTI